MAFRAFAPERVARPWLQRPGDPDDGARRGILGRPADDAAAIEEVERQRGRGARLLVLGRPAFWWLEQYPGLREHLDRQFRPVTRNDSILVWDLAAGGIRLTVPGLPRDGSSWGRPRAV